MRSDDRSWPIRQADLNKYYDILWYYFSMNPVHIHEGRGHSEGHSRQNYFCDTVQEMDSLQLLTVYLTLTRIFSGRKAKIDLHMTPKLTVVMPISCLLRYLFSFPARKMITSCTPRSDHLLHLCLFCMFSVEPRNKIVSWTYWLLPGLSNIFCNLSLLSSITQ